MRGLCPLIIACAACGTSANVAAVDASAPAEASVDAPAGTQGVELGTGARAWQSLPTDSPAPCEVVHGPQGGYHIFGRVRFRGLNPDVHVSFRLATPDGAAVLTNDLDRLRRMTGRGLIQTSEGYESASGELVILQIRSPAEVVGRRFRFEARVQEVSGTTVLTDAREITVVDDEP